MASQAESEEKIKAFVVFKFLNEFNSLEKSIKNYFKEQLSKLNSDDVNKLYFYYGGLASKNITIEYSKNKFGFNGHKFETNCFTDMSLNQIMKLANSASLADIFNIEIASFQKSFNHNVPSAMIKVINMRNKLAHEMSALNLTDKDDCIELLSKDKVIELGADIIYDLELKDEYDQIKLIYSNIIYMRKIKELLTIEPL